MNLDIKNVISIDVEQWFHRPILTKYLKKINPTSDHILNSVMLILNILEECEKRTTFFVLGHVAEHVPQVVKEIEMRGHEVAFHGYSHLKLSEVGEEKFENEVSRGVNALYKITGKRPKGFRSPMFSLNKNTSWALKTLAKFGFKYDSSIFPVKTPLYGSYSAPRRIYTPSFHDPSKEDPDQTNILEFPLLTNKITFMRLPAGGGFYSRLFGIDFTLNAVKKINKEGNSAMCYFHPWELTGFPRIDLPFHKKIFAYYRIPCLEIFKKLLRTLNIAPAIEVIEEYE